MSALRSLLAGIVDYAGLFPPAALELPAAVADYAAALRGPEAWMLGRFVVPAERLPELSLAASPYLREPGAGAAWRVSALLGADPETALREVERFNATEAPRAIVDAVEGKASRREEIEALLRTAPPALTCYVEVPLDPDPRPLLATLAARPARAKVRTGGLTPDAIPEPALLARFLAGCASLHLAFKATAGLHHPVRSARALTDEPGAPTATMHGFLNVFAAAALLREGRIDAAGAAALLAEARPEAFVFEDGRLRVAGHTLTAGELSSARAGFATSFGSCSFAEPVADLRALGLLEAA